MKFEQKKPLRAFYQAFDFLAFPFGAATFLLI